MTAIAAALVVGAILASLFVPFYSAFFYGILCIFGIGRVSLNSAFREAYRRNGRWFLSFFLIILAMAVSEEDHVLLRSFAMLGGLIGAVLCMTGMARVMRDVSIAEWGASQHRDRKVLFLAVVLSVATLAAIGFSEWSKGTLS